MSSFHFLAALLAVFATNILAVDEDFAFEITDDLEVEFSPENTKKTLGIPDELTAFVGRVFHYTIPKENYDENAKFEAKIKSGKPLPFWLLFDKTGGTFWGLPLAEDASNLHIIIKSVSPKETSPKEFNLNVIRNKDISGSRKCPSNEDNTILTLLIDKNIHSIKPKQRVVAINNIAKFFGLPYSAFSLQPQDHPDDLSDSSIVLAGPGNLETHSNKFGCIIRVNVGCDGRLWLNTATLVHQLKQQAKDGTVSEVLGLPLVGWRVISEENTPIRNKRQLDVFGNGGSGAGDYDDNFYEDEYDYDDPDYEYETKDDIVPISTHKPTPKTTPTTSTTTTTTTTTSTTTTTTQPPPIPTTIHYTTIQVSSTHHHRHHHGQLPPVDPTLINQSTHHETTGITVPIMNATETTTSTKIVSSSTSGAVPVITEQELPTLNYDDEDETDYTDEDDDIESETVVPVVSTRIDTNIEIIPNTETSIVDIATTKPVVVEFIPETTPLTTSTIVTNITTPTPITTSDLITTIKETIITEEEIEIPVTSSTSTTEKLTTTEAESTTTIKQTTVRHVPTTPKASTTTFYATETLEYDVKNFPPTIQNRLKRIATTAGKAFSFIVPPNTFTDLEDGESLILELLDNEGKVLEKNSWCQFNPRTKEIYGLPLEDDVSRWEYILKATDKEGASVSDHIEIMVQQHKSRRVVNHEFSLYMHIEKKWEFPHNIDWALKTLRGIGQLYRQYNLSDITVRRVNYTSEPVVFVWTNDSLPKSYCPTVEIEKLFEVLTANNEGDPSHALTRELIPELRVKKVTYRGLGVCETKPQPPPLVPIIPPTNFSPILRNPVDHINATVGELLVFRVPDDTFYDPEDVDSRNLKMSLLTVDRQQIPSDHWLQFDSKNKEFFGIPLPQDVGRSEYQLICEDSGGLPASDSLVVVVHVPPKLQYNVEFSMTLETPYETFVNSASMQRKFIEKLRDLFGDQNTSNIHLSSISRGSTIVSWYNKSLSLENCPRTEIKQLESILVNNDRTIASRVQDVMDPEFTVSTIKLQLIGSCKGRPNIQSPTSKGIPIDEPPISSDEDYLITVIVPIVLISTMLLLAGMFACVLYRRKRTGKMNVEEEDGRSSYGNKGIPVIFQEELEEKPEPGTKAPIILKDEKPPLAPPEYSKSGSLKLTDDSEPYQPPPPPFTRPQENTRQSRPKPTPTYRKPPPYVPP